MDFKDQIKILGERASKLKESIATEEATKTAIILPFIQSLGYDIFDPTEVKKLIIQFVKMEIQLY